MSKIYLVKYSSGEYDAYHEHNVKAFSNEEDANNYVNKWNRILNKWDTYLSDQFKEISSRADEGLKTTKDLEKWHEVMGEYQNSWMYDRHCTMEDFSPAWIEEIELVAEVDKKEH